MKPSFREFVLGLSQDPTVSSTNPLVRRGKAPSPSGCESRPATVAPAGSNRSG